MVVVAIATAVALSSLAALAMRKQHMLAAGLLGQFALDAALGLPLHAQSIHHRQP
jgi:hypothetical protein